MSFASFIIAPFLTNDGVCLLFVEIILNAFGEDEEDDFILGFQYPSRSETESAILVENNKSKEIKSTLTREDAVYFMLTLACSSNIGSALTYTGNPQNMIVSQDALDVMSPGLFLAYMALPSLLSWLISE